MLARPLALVALVILVTLTCGCGPANVGDAPCGASCAGDSGSASADTTKPPSAGDASAPTADGAADDDAAAASNDGSAPTADGSTATPDASTPGADGAPPPPPPPPPVTPPGWAPMRGIEAPPFGLAATPTTTATVSSWPSTVQPGSVIEVSGTFNGPKSITANCTQAKPCTIVGKGATIDGDLEVKGSYYVLEGFLVDNGRLRISGDHGVARDNEIRRHPSKNGTGISGSYMVMLRNHIHHHQGNDRHGVFVSSGSKDVWIVGNDIHHNGGDAIQFCHGCSSNPPSRVFIGNNKLHSDRENGVDLKYADRVVVSSNEMWGYRSAPANTNWCFDDNSKCATFSSGSDGAATVLGSDGAPTNVWMFDNDVHDSARGIRIEATTDPVIVGNDVHDIVSSCLHLEKNGGDVTFRNNSCRRDGDGIVQDWRDNFVVLVRGNLFSDIGGRALHLESSSVVNASRFDDNAFYPTAVLRLVKNNVSTSSAAQIDAAVNGSGNVVANKASAVSIADLAARFQTVFGYALK